MRNALALSLAAVLIAPVVLVGQALAAAQAYGAEPPLQPVCGDVQAPVFPITARIQGGPAAYRAGSGPGEFSVVLVNTTAETCRNIYPVVVLLGRDHLLTPARIRMEFYDEGSRTWRPVTFEQTDQGEAVGAFGGAATRARGFGGFTVPGRATVTIPVRLAFPATDTLADTVVANAAVVQRRGADGDWVGQSDDYTFSLLASEEQLYEVPLDAEELAPTGTHYDIGLAAAVSALLAAGLLLLAGARRLRSGRR
ncbi:hypothetical protein [Streptomyces sp. NPDC059909]|uniref:hypothetical protein n=1 Tax=Streptomyces sp. NPDC059909 TaxID=3346998 RepID=UPI003651D08F